MKPDARLEFLYEQPDIGSFIRGARMKSFDGIAIFVAFLGVLVPSVASADATALAYVQDERTPVPIPAPVTGAVQATMTGAGQGQSASALADQNTGILRAAGDSGAAYPYLTTANASASFSDLVTFSGGFGEKAFLDYSFEGTLGIFARPGSPAAASAQMFARVVDIGGSQTRYETLIGYEGVPCGSATKCKVGTSTARTGTLEFTISSGLTNIYASLSGFSSFGNTFDFGNTAKFYLRTPEGVTFSGADGFLAAATPIFTSAVPESETYALMLAGLGALGMMVRRRRPGGHP